MPVTISRFVERLFEARPGAGALGLLARQARLAGAVLDGVERDFDLVAGLDLDLAALVLELLERDDGLGLQADVDDDHVGRDVDDEPGEDHAGADALVGEALLRTAAAKLSVIPSLRTAAGTAYRLPASAAQEVDEQRPRVPARAAQKLQRSTTLPADQPRDSAPAAPALGRRPARSSGRSSRSRRASGAGFRGATARVESRRSRSAISRERAARLTSDPLSFNCL